MRTIIILLVVLASALGTVLGVGVCVGVMTLIILRLRRQQPLKQKQIVRYMMFAVGVSLGIWLITQVALLLAFQVYGRG